MDSVHRIELDWIAALQGTGAFKWVMLKFSYLGSEAIPFVLPFIYFVVSRAAGQRLYLFYSAGRCVLQMLKLTFHLPRPFWMDARIRALGGSGGYGMPSGHVFSATIVWPFVAGLLGKSWGWFAALAFVLLVSVSRVYLGVHFISDVVAAWAVGAAMHWLYGRVETRFAKWLEALGFSGQFLVTLGFSGALLAVFFGIKSVLTGVTDPPGWASFSVTARNWSGSVRLVGEFFGAAAGILLAERWARFEVGREWWKGVVAWAYALLGAWVIREFFETLPSLPTEALQLSVSFVQGVLFNGWTLLIAPRILLEAGLLDQSLMAPPRTGDPLPIEPPPVHPESGS